jgi:hypothetical protein
MLPPMPAPIRAIQELYCLEAPSMAPGPAVLRNIVHLATAAWDQGRLGRIWQLPFLHGLDIKVLTGHESNSVARTPLMLTQPPLTQLEALHRIMNEGATLRMLRPQQPSLEVVSFMTGRLGFGTVELLAGAMVDTGARSRRLRRLCRRSWRPEPAAHPGVAPGGRQGGFWRHAPARLCPMGAAGAGGGGNSGTGRGPAGSAAR